MTPLSKRLKVTPQQIVEAYSRLGTSKLVAAEFGIGSSSVLRLMQQAGVKAGGLEAYRQNARALSDEQNSEVRAKYESGTWSADLAREYGVTIYTIKQAIKRAGGDLRANPAPTLKENELDAMIVMHKQGFTQGQIATASGRSQAFVSRHMRDAGFDFEMPKREAHGQWKGGRMRAGGYWRVLVEVDDPIAASMRNNQGYVLEHRLVMARKLDRPLTPDETVHHIDGNPSNNAESNLQLRQGKHGKGVVHTCRDCGSHNVATERLATLE